MVYRTTALVVSFVLMKRTCNRDRDRGRVVAVGRVVQWIAGAGELPLHTT
jgi:hypothetical protein